MRILLFLKRGAGTSPCQKIEMLFRFITITTPTTKEKLSIPRKSQTKNQMALPVFQSMSSAEDQRNFLALLITAIYAMVVILTLFSFPTKNEKTKKTTDTTTPAPIKRAKIGRKCPGAPKPKRQRIGASPDIIPLAPRKLFDDIVCEDTDDKQCPDAPFKVVTKKRRTGCDETYNVATELIFDDIDTDDENKVCPDAPIKSKNLTKKFVLSKDDAVKIKFKFADIRTKPSKNDKFSAETQELMDAYKPSQMNDYAKINFMTTIHIIAQMFDITNPNRVIFNLDEQSIRKYHNDLVAFYRHIENLNYNKIVLPHAGTGQYTVRDSPTGDKYMLVDELSNAVMGIMIRNEQLVSALNTIYKKNKRSWTIVPDNYAKSCELCREIQMMSKRLHRELSNNMNKTSWADW